MILLAFGIDDAGAIFILTVTGIDEKVKRIVIEFEFLAVFFRHRAPYLQSTIVLICFIVVTAIGTTLLTVVCRDNICVDNISQRRISCLVCIFLSRCHAVADINILCLAELYGACAYESRSHVAVHVISLCFRYRTTDIQVNVTIGVILSYDISLFELSLITEISNSLRMSSLHGVVSSVNTLCDEVAHLILTLSEHTTRAGVLQMIGRSVFITRTSCLILCCSSTLNFSVPCVPVCRVVHLIGQHIARVVTHVVG